MKVVLFERDGTVVDEPGQAAGMKTILVKTGNFPTDGAEPTYEANNLSEVISYIVEITA